MESDPLSFLGGRKFVFAIFTATMAFVLACMLILPVDQFVSFIEFVFATYVAGNLVTKATDKIK